jgi:hypothetical protein
MFRARSSFQRARISVVLLVALCAGPVTLPHAEGPDDSACRPVLVSHDESAHFIGAAPSTSETDSQHCYLCHSARSFSSLFEKHEQRDRALGAERLHAAPVALADRLEWSLVLGRAPPA